MHGGLSRKELSNITTNDVTNLEDGTIRIALPAERCTSGKKSGSKIFFIPANLALYVKKYAQLRESSNVMTNESNSRFFVIHKNGRFVGKPASNNKAIIIC